MKRLLLIILLLPILGVSSHIDSLQTLLNKETNPDKKVKLYIKIAKSYLGTELNKTDSILDLALKYSTEEQYKKGVIKVTVQKGTVKLRKGKYENALLDYKWCLNESLKYKYDTLEATSYLNIASCMDFLTLIDSCRYYNFQAIYSAIKLNDTLLKAQANNNLGIAYYYNGDHDSSIKYYENSLVLYELMNDSIGMTDVIFNNANNYYAQGDYKYALQKYLEAANNYDKIGNQYNRGLCLHNAGQLYTSIDLFDDAIEVLTTSRKIFEKAGSNIYVAQSNILLANVYETTNRKDTALVLYQQSLKTFEELNDIPSISSVSRAIGELFLNKKDYLNAEKYLKKAVESSDLAGTKPEQLRNYLEYGKLMFFKNNYKEALNWYNKSEELANITNDRRQLNLLYLAKYELYKKNNNFSESLKYHELYTANKDSILNEEKIKELAQLEEQFKNKERKKEISLLEKEKSIQKEIITAQNERQKLLYIVLALVGFTLIMIVYFLYNKHKSNLIIKQQKEEVDEINEELNQTNEELAAQRDEIEKQKHKVEEAHQEIKDSIIYAKRIQNAILPTQELISELLPKSFVLYQPKDVVAGDFYWLEQIASASNNSLGTVLFAAADCTGHGVPGAMVSVVCHNAMNRAVREFKLAEPGKILDKTREIVLEELSKSKEDVKDGMDIALCSLSGNKLKYAGAHNPLWIVRNNEILETKADKQPIGKFDNPTPFITHEIELQKGDSIYIFSDGYIDQFGGEKDKKFGSRKFKELLVSIQDKPMLEQNSIFNTEITSWMNQSNNEQLDDICIMGVKI